MKNLEILNKLNAIEPLNSIERREFNQLLWWEKYQHLDSFTLDVFSESDDEGGANMYCRIESVTISKDKEDAFMECNFVKGKYEGRLYNYGLRFQEALIEDYNKQCDPDWVMLYPTNVSCDDTEKIKELNDIFKYVLNAINYKITSNFEEALDYINDDAKFKNDINEDNFLNYDYSGDCVKKPNFLNNKIEIILKNNKEYLINLLKCYD